MFAPGYAITIPTLVSVFTKGIGWFGADLATTPPVSASYEAAARAVYYPILLPSECVVRRVWWANGATTSGGATIAVGVYSDAGYGPGIKIVGGSATQGTANQVQFADVTDSPLAPGLHWLAVMASSITNTRLFRCSPSVLVSPDFRFHENAADPLPATATPTAAANGFVWVFGFATTASP